MTLTRYLRGECDVRAAERRTNSLAALAVTLLLVSLSLYLVEVLRANAALQDCVLSGRMGCAASGD